MSWRRGLAACLLLAAPACALADDQALWREFGLVERTVTQQGPLSIRAYRMKDLTGALAAWQWQRLPGSKPCKLSAFCAQDDQHTLIADNNYLLAVDGPLTQAALDAELKSLTKRRETSLPAILTFVPRQGLRPNSSRYVLGPASLNAFAPELNDAKPGFEDGAEAQIGDYQTDKTGAISRLAVFYYPTPEMSRLHAIAFHNVPNAHVKRSGVLIATVFGNATDAQADTLLSRVEYEARITWNDIPPPSPIKPLYRLLTNIIYASIALSALCLMAGLLYAGMRIYRRRYGSLDADEAMTTLHLTD